MARPHRLVAKDTTLSRWRHGFESRWGCQEDLPIRAGQALFVGCRLVTFQYRKRPPLPDA